MMHIEFAGVDGSGKSTQAGLLAYALSSQCLVRERKETGLLDLLTRLALMESGDPIRAFGADTFFLLRMMEAHLDDERALRARCDQDVVLISPRSQLDRVAAALASGVKERTLVALKELASAHCPAVGIFLAVDPDIALERIAARGGEPEPDREFFHAFAKHLGMLAKRNGYREVDASRDADHVSLTVLGEVCSHGIS